MHPVPLDVYRFLRRELDSTYIQFIPIVQLKHFETTAPQTWDSSTLPWLGSPEARPDHPNSVVTDWSVDARNTVIFSPGFSTSGVAKILAEYS